MKEVYSGPLDTKKMGRLARRAYWIWARQKYSPAGSVYGSREFIGWYLAEHKKRTWKRVHCGRKDHSKPYSFDNILLQESRDNTLERNARRGNPTRRQKVVATLHFGSKKEAAKFLGVSEKTIYNHCQKRTKTPFKFGPNAGRKMSFKWAT